MNFILKYFNEAGLQEIIAQIIGFIAMIIFMASFQQKSRKGILMYQLVSEAFWVLHYGLKGAYTGMALNFLGVFRCYVFANRDTKKWADYKYMPFIFFVLAAAAGALTWNGPKSLLPTAAVCITSFVLWSKRPDIIRYFSYPGCTCWLIYNYISGSYPGVLTELFNIGSITVGILRFDIGKKKKQPEQTASKAADNKI